ncbi:unnamed protein product [Moneuplotes crassus]|uniref:Uncharacterized protein n=1 Tax=Euplotes crassus TaxID=5936 RepID=A0AAD1XBA0_EUPCR|nr:unnamed protein product [Moneuplotes crassus]
MNEDFYFENEDACSKESHVASKILSLKKKSELEADRMSMAMLKYLATKDDMSPQARKARENSAPLLIRMMRQIKFFSQRDIDEQDYMLFGKLLPSLANLLVECM